jgi:hypothetical protein
LVPKASKLSPDGSTLYVLGSFDDVFVTVSTFNLSNPDTSGITESFV